MKTLPKAACVLHANGNAESSRSLRLFSDDEGIIRFNASPRQESDEVAALAVDCTSDGQSRTFGLELRPNHIPSFDMPAPAAEKRKPQANDVIRPALANAEALQLSNEEIIKREYPMRPNPNESPDAFAAWLKVVSHPARRVNPRQVVHPEIRATSNWEIHPTWSGFELRNPSCDPQCGLYDLVESEWNVPALLNKAEEDTRTFLLSGLDSTAMDLQLAICGRPERLKR